MQMHADGHCGPSSSTLDIGAGSPFFALLGSGLKPRTESKHIFIPRLLLAVEALYPRTHGWQSFQVITCNL
jgi:hypothetical protein